MPSSVQINSGVRVCGSATLPLAVAAVFLVMLPAAAHRNPSDVRGGPSAPVMGSALVLAGDWPTFGNGPQHTGYFPGYVGEMLFTEGWSMNVGGTLQQVAVGDGRIFVTPYQYFRAAYLAALDELTGEELWRYEFETCYSINPPTYDGGFVYVQRGNHGSDTHLWCFNAASGVPVWIAPHSAQWERYMAPTVADGGIWINGGYYGGMYGFDQADGTQRFFVNLPQYDEWTPTYCDNTVYSWVEGVFAAHDSLDGSKLWSLDLGWDWHGWSMNTVSAVAGGRAYVVGSPNLHAIDLASGTEAWEAPGGFLGSPPVANGVVYAIADGFVEAYAASDGSYIGVYPGDSKLRWQAIVTDDVLIAASSSNTYVYSLDTFKPLQRIPYGGYLSLANDVLYIATDTGELRTYVLTVAARPVCSFVYSPADPSTADVVTFDGSASHDPDGYIVEHAWGFGDGTSSVNGAVVTHRYTDDGTYTITLMVTDDVGAATSCSDAITVSTVPPTCDIAYLPNEPHPGETVDFDSNATDPDGTVASVAWDFRDGMTGSGLTTTHAYIEAGSYPVTVTVTDDDDASSTCSIAVRVDLHNHDVGVKLFQSPHMAKVGRTGSLRARIQNYTSLDEPTVVVSFIQTDSGEVIAQETMSLGPKRAATVTADYMFTLEDVPIVTFECTVDVPFDGDPANDAATSISIARPPWPWWVGVLSGG